MYRATFATKKTGSHVTSATRIGLSLLAAAGFLAVDLTAAFAQDYRGRNRYGDDVMLVTPDGEILDYVPRADEVQTMREKVRAARPVKDGLFDVKHSEGGMMDAEFALQTLVLANGADHPELLDNLGNIALLQRCESVGLLPAGVGVGAANAYRELRRVQHKARLDEQSTALDAEAAAPLVAHRQAVKALWLAVFG